MENTPELQVCTLSKTMPSRFQMSRALNVNREQKKKKKSILQRKLSILHWFNEVVDQLHIPEGELLSAVLKQWREEEYITIDGIYSVYD